MLPQTKIVKKALKDLGLENKKVLHSNAVKCKHVNPETGRVVRWTEYRGSAYVVVDLTKEQVLRAKELKINVEQVHPDYDVYIIES